jgi:streptogramin lyase
MAGCSGGGGGASAIVPPSAGNPGGNPGGNTTPTAKVRVSLVIPKPAPSTTGKSRRLFVSPSTNGVSVTTFAHSDTTHSTPLATAVTNVSATSNACTSGTNGRTCTVAISAPVGTDDFVFALFDTAPVGNAIPASAHELGTAGVTQTVTANTENTIAAPISAIVAGLSGSTATVLEPTDGHSHQVALAVTPTDFGNNPITAGASNAPFANPIAASVSETGGNGHTLLSLNGGTPAATATLSKATDTLAAVYDGTQGAGYQATVTLSASAIGSQGGATQESLALMHSNLAVTNATVFYTPLPAALDTYPQGQHVLLISEPGAPSGTQYTANASGCANILSTGTVIGSGANATLLVVGGTQTATSGCTVGISDGTTTFTVNVTNTLRAAPGNAPAITEFSIGTSEPFAIATGADGNLWFTDEFNDSIDKIAPHTTNFSSISVTGNGIQTPFGITQGPDGNIWFGDFDTNIVSSVTPSGTVTTFGNQSAAFSNFPVAGLDGNVWFGECNGSILGSIATATGTLTEHTIPSGSEPFNATLGPNNGAIWFFLLDPTPPSGPLGEIAQGQFTQFPATPAMAPGNEEPGITSGSDGAVWFTEQGDIGRSDTSGNITNDSVGGAAPNTDYIVAGPDGALWFTDSGNNAIGRITTSGSVTEYPLPTLNAAPTGITVGPDGNIWFTELNADAIGTLVL